MIPYLAVLLIPSLAFAAAPTQTPTMGEWAKSQWKQHNGVLYLRVPIGNATWCFSQKTAAIADKSSDWEYVAPQVVVAAMPTVEHIQVCTDTLPPPVWIVAQNPTTTDNTRPLKDAAFVNRWRIAVGLPCEGVTAKPINSAYEYRWATNSAGQRGITVCLKR